MNTRAFLTPAAGLILGISGMHAGGEKPFRKPESVVRSVSSGPSARAIINVHLSTFLTMPDGKPVVGAPAVHALVQFDCDQKMYRRMGVDFERPDGVVVILPDSLATYGWRSTTPGDPEALQLQAVCSSR